MKLPVIQKISLGYTLASAVALSAAALLHHKVPTWMLSVHWVILGFFFGDATARYFRARRAFREARGRHHAITEGLIRDLIESGYLNHDREPPSLEEILPIMSLATILHTYEREYPLEIAMLDGWLAHWGVTRAEPELPAKRGLAKYFWRGL